MALTDNLVSYWSLDEASGTRNDSHGANHLTDNNTVASAAGKIGNAGQFVRASSEYLSRADDATLSAGDIDFSLTAWVYLDSKPGSQMTAVSKYGVGAEREWTLYWNSASDRFAFYCVGGAGENGMDATGAGAPTLGAWYFLIVWHDAAGNTLNLSVNNGTAASLAFTFGSQDSPAQFRIGSRADAGLHWDGRIDEVGFWKRVLTSAERTELYNGGAGLSYSSFASAAAKKKKLAHYRSRSVAL